jgi:hypothetical protein
MTATRITSLALASPTTYSQLPLACGLHYHTRWYRERLAKWKLLMLSVDWRSPMLRIEFHDAANTVTMRLEGRFVGPFAKDARELVTRCKIPPRLVVNLSEVTFVDAVGEEVLSWLGRIGGEFVAENCYPLHVCERLHLPMARKRVEALPQAM